MVNTIIVDDSIIFRNILEGIFEKEPQYNVVASFFNGKQLIDFLKKGENIPDLITLDLEMPILDGIKTLKRLKVLKDFDPKLKKIKVVIVSNYSKDEADITNEAIKLGATNCILKPKEGDFTQSIIKLRREIRNKINPLFNNINNSNLSKTTVIDSKTILNNPTTLPSKTKIEAIAIGISTGGPQTLLRILPTISARITQPIFIVQHIPEGFSNSLANSLNQKCKHNVVEAEDNMIVQDNYIYIAKGGYHMEVKTINNQKVIKLNNSPPKNNCKPSVDILFNSLAPIYKDRLIALILTGMGNDGSTSLENLKKYNTHTIAQDEKSSIVWGMPRVAIQTGFIDKIVPLDEIPDEITRIMRNNIKQKD